MKEISTNKNLNEGVLIFLALLKNLSILNYIYLFNLYNDRFTKIDRIVFTNVRTNTQEVQVAWIKSLENLKFQILDDIDVFLNNSGKENNMDSYKSFIQDIKKDLKELTPITAIHIKSSEYETKEIFLKEIMDDINNEIINEVKKGNRASFKLIQELLEKFEELSERSNLNDKAIIDDEIKMVKKETNEFINLILKSIDSMELVYESAVKSELDNWAKEINQVIENYIMELEAIGIQEIKAIGEFIDGEAMISVGTISNDQAPHLQKFQVYCVHERGFRNSHTGQIIREAKVTTVY